MVDSIQIWDPAKLTKISQDLNNINTRYKKSYILILL